MSVAAKPGTALGRSEHVLRRGVEGAAAALLVVEIAILSAGVVARYLLSSPLTWVDELASVLFLWLGILGSVLALDRSQHMRMSALADACSASTRRRLDVLSLTICFSFALLAVRPAYEYALDDLDIVTPALEVSGAWRSSAIVVGLGLMILRLVSYAWSLPDRSTAIKAFATSVLIVFALSFLAQSMSGLGNLNLFIFFIVVVGFGVAIGSPIAFVFGFASFAYVLLSTRTPSQVLVGRFDEGMSNPVLLAIPLFVFLGLLMQMAGFANAMVGFLATLLRRVRGGLFYVLLGAMYLVSGISGSKTADMAAIAPGLFPEMQKRGSKPGDLVALLAAAGAQTETIPPSFVLITTGSVTGVSIASLFTGGMVPALVVGLCLCVVVWFRNRHEDVSGLSRPAPSEVGRSFLVAIPALALPFLIRTSIVEGVATATEVSVIGILYIVVVGNLVYRSFAWNRIFHMLVATASLSGAILLINGAATTIAWSLTQAGFSHDLAALIRGLPGGSTSFLAVSVLMFVVLGTILEGLPCIVLFAPLMFPIAHEVGVHPVHYAMVVILSMGIGLFLPPFGVGYYAACAVSQVDPKEGLRPIARYVVALVIGVGLVVVFPWLSTGFLSKP